MHRRRLAAILTAVAMAIATAGCGSSTGPGLDGIGRADASQADQAPAYEESTTTSPPTLSGMTSSGSYGTESGYRWTVEYEVQFTSARVEIANSPPGRAQVHVEGHAMATIVNETPGRNLPAQAIAVRAFFTPEQFRSAGHTPEHEWTTRACSDGLCLLGSFGSVDQSLDINVAQVPAGESLTVDLPLSRSSFEVPEDQAEATVELIERGEPLWLGTTIGKAEGVSSCGPRLIVWIKDQWSIGATKSCEDGDLVR